MIRAVLLETTHDARHRLGAEPHARESLVWLLQLPEEGLAATWYTWVGGDGKAGYAVCVYGPAIGQEPIFELTDGVAVSGDMDFDDWRVGGLHVRQGEPLQVAEFTYTGDQVETEYRFDALHPPYSYAATAQGCPPFLAADRFEQSGRVRGVLRVRGRELAFDTTANRDHSWGTRDWGIAQHWKWLHCQAGPKRAVHAFQVYALGRTMQWGYVLKDGALSELERVEFDSEFDERWMHRAVGATIVDRAGRATVVRGERFAAYPFPVSPLATLNEVSMTFSIDGHRGVGHVEMCWPPGHLAYLQGLHRDRAPD